VEFTEFTETDLSEYQDWFSDESLNKRLGPVPDREWMDYILNDKFGKQFCVFEGAEFVAVVGVVLPTVDHPFCVISDIAVRPCFRGTGIGRRALEFLTSSKQLCCGLLPPVGQAWRAYVEKSNLGAKKFFLAIGWELKPDLVDDDSMHVFDLPFRQ
jgi:ribosomal protein S18 acetylase RimI-like enzyme